MEYREIQQQVERLDFIRDRDEADAAIKAVLGVFASRLDEPSARRFTDQLSGPLTYDKLRGVQQDGLPVSADDYVGVISNQFELDDTRARRLIEVVLDNTREMIGDAAFQGFVDQLPDNRANLTRGATRA